MDTYEPFAKENLSQFNSITPQQFSYHFQLFEHLPIESDVYLNFSNYRLYQSKIRFIGTQVIFKRMF